MKTWLSPSETAGLEGMPKTGRGVKLLAARSGWPSRPRKGRGGGVEYPIDILPESARIDYARRAAETNLGKPRGEGINNDAVRSASPPPAANFNLTNKQQARADARLAIVAACDAFIHDGCLPSNSGTAAFAKLYNTGRILPRPEVRAAVPTLCANSILNWRKTIKLDGAAALAGRHGHHRLGSGIIESNPDIKDYVIGLLATKPHVDARQIHAGLNARFADAGVKLPSARSISRFVARWKKENAGVFQAVTDPDAFRSHRGAAFGHAAEKIIALNQCWELDSTPADVLLADGRRHAIIGVIDVWTRRAKVLVSPTSRAAAIAALLRLAIIDWGLPATVKTDNGTDYVSHHMTRALADLKIRQILCPPYSPDKKPHIERFLGTLSHQFLELLPGYVGHDVAGRKQIENRKSFAARRGGADAVEISLTAAELQEKLDAWCDDVYGRQPHAGLPGDVSPFVRAASWAGILSTVENHRALDVLLAEAPDRGGIRTVSKKGLSLDGAVFIAGELGAWIGCRVHVRYDAADMGCLYVFDADTSAFICIAECPERTGISREDAALAAKRSQRALIRAGKADLRRAANRIKPETIAEDILAHGRRQAAAVVALPKPSVDHQTPALDAAAEAAQLADGGGNPAPALTPIEEDALEAVQAAASDAEVIPLRPETDPAHMDDASFVRWVEDNPGEVSDDQRDYAAKLMKDCPSLRMILEG